MNLKPISPPRGLFQGRNFMTPNIVGYYKLRLGYAELSAGTGITNQAIYGVTCKPDDGRSKLFQSRAEAMKYIEGLS
jgi:hypothetical protein